MSRAGMGPAVEPTTAPAAEVRTRSVDWFLLV
jgi:hypothetical protein